MELEINNSSDNALLLGLKRKRDNNNGDIVSDTGTGDGKVPKEIVASGAGIGSLKATREAARKRRNNEIASKIAAFREELMITVEHFDGEDEEDEQDDDESADGATVTDGGSGDTDDDKVEDRDANPFSVFSRLTFDEMLDNDDFQDSMRELYEIHFGRSSSSDCGLDDNRDQFFKDIHERLKVACDYLHYSVLEEVKRMTRTVPDNEISLAILAADKYQAMFKEQFSIAFTNLSDSE
jgi:hypothetical protein